MKIEKKLIKELVDHLDEFKLTELEYQEGNKRIKVSKGVKSQDTSRGNTVISSNKAVFIASTIITVCPFFILSPI